MLPGADAESAYDFADRLRQVIATGDAPVASTISAGVAASEVPTSVQALTGAADRALYAAKRGGRNRVALRR